MTELVASSVTTNLASSAPSATPATSRVSSTKRRAAPGASKLALKARDTSTWIEGRRWSFNGIPENYPTSDVPTPEDHPGPDPGPEPQETGQASSPRLGRDK